jgi:hypothetical protein
MKKSYQIFETAEDAEDRRDYGFGQSTSSSILCVLCGLTASHQNNLMKRIVGKQNSAFQWLFLHFSKSTASIIWKQNKYPSIMCMKN